MAKRAGIILLIFASAGLGGLLLVASFVYGWDALSGISRPFVRQGCQTPVTPSWARR